MYKVYGNMLSGNCYKIKLLMEFLEIQHEWMPIDIMAGENRACDVVRLKGNGKIPLLQINESEFLTESNAILNYLATGTIFLPNDNFIRAKILQWQFFEQYSHEPYIAVARYINKFLGMPADKIRQYQSKQEGGHAALKIMETQLAVSPFFVGEAPTIADISLYAYTHVAADGGFDLVDYPHINAWLARIVAMPNYVAME
ncbi:MAG: glutathione S-transferase family protein [Gammaproteobacteria bacterium WSBS_2016_MAG_OTU1]